MMALGKRTSPDWTFTVNFAESSRRPRDTRPLSRWGVMVTMDPKRSDFRTCHLKIDGAVNDAVMVPFEVHPS